MPARAGRCSMPARARSGRGACATPVSAGFRLRREPPMPLLDGVARRWLTRSQSPYVQEIQAIAVALGFPGIWFLNGSYQWSCTALAREEDGAPWLARTLDWPFPGLGRYVEIARMRGRGGRIFQRHLAGLCRRADRARAGPLRRRDQPGAAAPPHPGRLLRLFDFAANALATLLPAARHPAGPAAALRVRGRRATTTRRKRMLERRRSRGR